MTQITLDLNISTSTSIDVASCVTAANEGAGLNDECWRMLWHEPMRSDHLVAVTELSDSLKNNCKNLLVIGIGGSALGAKALHSALADPAITPNFFVLDNIDPHTVRRTITDIKGVDPTFEHTVVVVISKSGETTEVAALSMVVENAMEQATFVAITGESGSLRRAATKKQWATLPVPDGVGGRFSVLSPVGLFPAAMCSIDTGALLDGAKLMDERCTQAEDNPAAALAGALVSAMGDGRSTHVMMPYCDRLRAFAHWYVQLWAESLGKYNGARERVGPTPIPAIGVTDQHSMLQLWREGPADKVIGFVRVLETEDIALGKVAFDDTKKWLCGQTLGSLMHAEQSATEESMHDANQATWTLTFERLDANTIGQFIALWQDTVAIAGRLLNINAYDQRGVEHTKQLTQNAFTQK